MSKKREKETGWDDSIRTLVYALLMAMLFRSFLVEPFHIPSGSMKDTLLIGDYLFVSKYSYGYSRYSFPFAPPLFEGRIFEDAPKRGDVVVFRPPNSPRVDFIKRVVGLPGDRIQMKESELYLNGKRVPRIPAGEFEDEDSFGRPVMAKRYIESLPLGEGERDHNVLDWGVTDSINGFSPDNTAVYTVPEGHYFMMGDNRDNSADSRFRDGVGFVPAENLVGRAEFILFSIGDDARFWQLWRWPTALRWDRFFHGIE